MLWSFVRAGQIHHQRAPVSMSTSRDDDEEDIEDYEEPQGDSTGGLIPYKNPSALIAYYCGLFSLFPLLGLFLGIAGLVLGIKGLKYRNQHPEVRGSVHAWIGIIMGGLMTVIWGLAIVGIIIAIIAENARGNGG
jgi:hypothetical protein